jgi:glutamine synthetase
MFLNTIIAEELSQFADVLEGAEDFTKALNDLIKETISNHKRIIFNGNNYSEEWIAEAAKRGLLNLQSTVDALPYLICEKNIKLFTQHRIFTESEIHSRYEILMENYCKTINIEALTMLDMVKKDIIPAVSSYIKELSETAIAKRALSPEMNCDLESSLVSQLSSLAGPLYKGTRKLEEDLRGLKNIDTMEAQGKYCRDVIFLDMQELRAVADEIESLVGERFWPYPTYGQLLFSV